MQKEICYHNFWAPLANLEDASTMEADEIAATFVETSKKIAVDLTLYKASNRRPKRFYLTPSILKEIRAKDLAAAEWHKATESKNPSKKVKMLYLAFSKKRKEVKELIQTFNRDRWAKFLDKGAKIVVSQNDRDAVRDETGNLLTSPDKVMQRWSEFYTALSSHSTVPIPKKGGPQSLDNYRGIALIPVGMKILGRIIIGRITRQLEARKKIAFLQAGFRRGEEAMAQVVSLYDILSRRRVAKKETFVAFIDFKKAYVTVPIKALLRKLYLCGVEGRAYEFFAAYYKSPEAGVRIGTLMSPLFKVDKGVRQGCPMSPMLFNIFINDILDKVNQNIALVPGNSVKILGLLFANDLVLLADSEVGLRENLLVVEKWANDNEMFFGISKCGALPVGGSFEHPDILELQGQRVPIVKEYWYLGVLINDELDLLKFCRHKVEKAEACYTNIRRLLSSKSVPMASRVLFLRGDVSTPIGLLLKDRSNGSWGKVSNGWLNRNGLKDSFYIKYEFQKTNSYWKIGSKYPSYSVGLTWYAMWRCGGIWNSYLAHKVGRGFGEIKGKCPLCRCVMEHDI
ncbi:LINE-1 reverse transcriptase-like protein [Smittium culicis]|uniref:LINE-1 reverse transcriptase-like protein n=1 Tax=Smittium culicis TaxID=133412 RepID=A0A1R1XRI8_9FUNG|nr:LINE-1 reverse transcriptase-like protein [Smittium culicis]